MWTLNKIISQNKTQAGFTYVFEAINENGDVTTFFHSYKEQPTEENMQLQAQNHINDLLNATIE